MSKSREHVVQRWTAKKRMALVNSTIKGETSVQEAARKHGLRAAQIEGWWRRRRQGAGGKGAPESPGLQ